MSNMLSQPDTDISYKKQNLLNTKLSERFHHLPSPKKACQTRFDRLSEFEQKQLIKKFKIEYSLILFDYFSDRDSINTKIANFSQEAFKVCLPLAKVVEIHMDIIDSLEHQLMLEGLYDEYISDFRLTLIDVIAHLGEIYRNAVCTTYPGRNLSVAEDIRLIK